MKKTCKIPFFSLLIFIIMAGGLTGCPLNKKKYPEFNVIVNEELNIIELDYDGIIYRPYGIFPNANFRDIQIGIRKGDPKSKIYKVKGYASSQWVIDYLDEFMSSGDMLFKAVGLTDIPSQLEQYKEYSYE